MSWIHRAHRGEVIHLHDGAPVADLHVREVDGGVILGLHALRALAVSCQGGARGNQTPAHDGVVVSLPPGRELALSWGEPPARHHVSITCSGRQAEIHVQAPAGVHITVQGSTR